MAVFNDSCNPSQTYFTTSGGKLQLCAATSLSFVTDSGTAVSAANTLTIAGGTNMNSSGSSSTVSLNLEAGAGGNPPDPHVPDTLFSRRSIIDEWYFNPVSVTTPVRGRWVRIGSSTPTITSATASLMRGRVGVQALTTTASTSQGWYAYCPLCIGTQEMSMGWAVAFDLASGWGAGAYAHFGLSGTNPSTASAPTIGTWFYCDPSYSANFICRSGDGIGVEETNSGVAINTSWHKFMIWANNTATSVEFYIDGTLVATHNANIPADTDELFCTYAQYHSQAKLHYDTVYYLSESLSL